MSETDLKILIKMVIELGGLGVFSYVIYREQVKIRETLYGLRIDFQQFLSKLYDREKGL